MQHRGVVAVHDAPDSRRTHAESSRITYIAMFLMRTRWGSRDRSQYGIARRVEVVRKGVDHALDAAGSWAISAGRGMPPIWMQQSRQKFASVGRTLVIQSVHHAPAYCRRG